ncbi:4-hydroxy-3-methylbut-2-en-1-yl diphosphate synthase [Thermoanaerobacterium thermosaccharolyticum]|jgi:(E)-4-hydroxy-3-methylbut-2-enyl-diphosphate synthase|uniref:4-hydroxy-3-methylbut-2-en-1-yl diphosphate synthase (flavodoxin) n=1 Tax=Thermoanaerobacterium thermosaccharolyticum (strain ATCC 7956 / DSM 571 / NCIMB 9385 / NCA 3814 / NCTC 13789 / WDCM 00135 / 2032) TaxID=580327 RepID=D9TM71_THETC|nr:flavodoxin-dependent (E)-4-hydroxy-3-methylbut-2-enyl-diphosphate synthase [Thermoanaerobacterium thermosaccharolyticum]TCW38653.1 4-hydroxy-3-methylbut-2-en-1-yl diphosphate synthase [Thermohydrogenium kirishiense]ADL68930.1 1-hydroxy-2-methyl-2-(E)-butenyl 4-diphosphate synthase [Thermoanaerobacterium thermosaccharolyticum DSM 571]KAA5807739.1 flavodoxin-dependent (E)-4-hydroxy-3-methylbut-2-enyl-diphosphate synthase [Thermoanaerobacterium thermosaccharolyticum]MBE0068054.1 flavodoxin-depe
MRKKTKEVRIGNIYIGGNNPIAVQSMTNTDTKDIKKTVNQIRDLQNAGCDIVRVAVLDFEAANAIKEIKKEINIPIVADIHFNYRLAIEAIKNGADKIRINPGNIGGEDKLKLVADAAKDSGIPIRVGVNSGSLEKDILNKYGGVTAEGIVESALKSVSLLEKCGFYDIVISLKTSNVPLTIESYKLISEKVNYPLHVGVTEAGTSCSGTIKSSIGIGTLLYMGIGDTIRVSLTGNPLEEVKVGKQILKSLGLSKGGVEIISCPTCGRTKINLIDLAKKVENATASIKEDIKIAVMGCAVNGPGEAKEADIGIAGGAGEGLIFKHGKVLKKVPEDRLFDEFMKELYDMLKEKSS